MSANLSMVRAAAGRKGGRIGARARWGAARGESKTFRIDATTFEALQSIPERDRRELASRAIDRAVAEYKKG